MSVTGAKEGMPTVLKRLNKDKLRMVYAFAQWLSEEELTEEEIRQVGRARKQFRDGRFGWWRDVKRT